MRERETEKGWPCGRDRHDLDLLSPLEQRERERDRQTDRQRQTNRDRNVMLNLLVGGHRHVTAVLTILSVLC